MSTFEERTVLITGGAGFIGSNLSERLLKTEGIRVRIFDNLSRDGVRHNLTWLQSLPFGERLEFIHGDIRDAAAVTQAAHDATEIYHLAAQVAVTTSVDSPRGDLEVNLLGTFNVLEAARRSGRRPFVLFTSTNKVYGSLSSIPVHLRGSRYEATDMAFQGVGEETILDFYSPYGCSKGSADQYVRDYARIYDLPTVVFRMSCIAGPRQFGNEDQGWVAHFLYSALEGLPVTVYGDGFQVRDVLHVYDLVEAMDLTWRHRDVTAGQIYNVGGGMKQSVSVREMLAAVDEETDVKVKIQFSDVRTGDQPLYISDTRKLMHATGWVAKKDLQSILKAIHQFWHDYRSLFHQRRSGDIARQELQEEVA